MSSDPPVGSQDGARTTDWRRLVALVALPRSGTTVTTAILGAHSDVHEVFEPWNANKADLDAGEPMDYAAFVARFAPPQPDRGTLLVKETTTSGKYLDRLVELLNSAPATVDRRLVLLLRNPFHVFLSECEARREWWGKTDLIVDADVFNQWATRTLHNCRRLAVAAEAFDALCLSYEALVAQPDTLTQLLTMLGLPAEDHRTDYFKHIDVGAVRGDRNVAEGAEALHDRSIATREQEFESLRAELRRAPLFRSIRQLAHQVAAMRPVAPASAAKPLMRVLQGRRADGQGALGERPARVVARQAPRPIRR